jgi:uncharacterized protein YcfJ
MNGRFLAIIALGAGLVAGAANAHGSRYANARVIGYEPVYETVYVSRPIRRCHREIVERRVSSPNVAGQTLAGAIVGAAIGRQFGDGSGRDALTVLGAVAGSAVANERALRRRGADPYVIVQEPVERCSTEYRRQAERRLTGYWVDYRYRGRNYRIMSHERPGRNIRILVRS